MSGPLLRAARASVVTVLAVVALFVGVGCIKDLRPSQERGASGLYDRAKVIDLPEGAVDRCERIAQTGGRPGCRDARYLGQLYVRRLGTLDPVCLERGFGEEEPPRCMARATVADTGPGKILIEIREAVPESRWFSQVQHQLWFTEAALVDLYLAERGY